MRLAYAFIAHAAEFTPNDGRLWVLGGDFDTITAAEIPAIHSVMTLVVKLLVQPTECQREHRLRIELIDSDGARVHPEIGGPFMPSVRQDYPHRPVGVGMALTFLQLRLPHYGDYAFHILVDDLELGTLPLYLVQPV
jgi:hypothetical protein